MNENDENRFGYLRKHTIEELERIKRALLDDNEYIASHAASSFQETDFRNETKFNNEQIDFIEKIIKEKTGNVALEEKKGRGRK